MMLDSSPGKLLSTKPVEASIPSNVDNAIANSASTTPTATIANVGDTNAHSTKSEAEVRLVVRFFVEEHVVFNGRVERIKQLESEELSRLVSRIAWNGSTEEKKPVLQQGEINVDENIGCVETTRERMGLYEPTKIFSCEHDSTIHEDLTKNALIKNHHDEHPINLKNSLFINPVDSVTKSKKTETVDDTNLTHDGKNASSEPVGENSNLQCDNKPATPISNHICEAHQQSESSYSIDRENQEIFQKDVNELPCSEYAKLRGAMGQVEFSSVERQTIVDTIYDCVYNVEMESCQVQHNGLITNGCSPSPQIEENFRDSKCIKHNGTINEDTNFDKIPLTEEFNIQPNNELSHETIPGYSEDEQFRDQNAQINQAGKNDLNPSMVLSKKTDNVGSCSSRKKIVNDNGPVSKRIRRANSKDQRNHRSTIRSSENLDELTGDIFADPSIEDEDVRFARHSKVFAKWSDNHFYPGTILKSSRDRKFEIGFFDGARKDVAQSDLIPSSNILRKQVRVSIAKDYCVNAIVHEQLSSNGQLMFDVEYQQNGLVRKCVPLGDIFLTAEQGIPLINQTIKPDKNPDESMFAGVDLDNIVHVKRSRRLQEMEEAEATEDCLGNTSNSINGGRRKRGHYNTRNITNRVRTGNRIEGSCDRVTKKSLTDINHQDTPTSSCSPDILKSTLDSPSLSSPSESSSSREASKF